MTIPDDRLNIATPENVAFDYQVAGIGSRFLGALVDTLLLVLLQLVVQITLIAIFAILRNLSLETIETDMTWFAAAFGLVGFAFFWGYYIYFETAWNGQTPGKRLAGLRVIRSDGSPITLSEAVIRNLIRLVDFLPIAYGIGVLSMFIDRHSRRLGDLAAGTLVIRDRSAPTLSKLASRQRSLDASTSQATLASIDSYPLRILSNQDIQMVEDYLRRRDELADPDLVARQILGTLLTKMNLPEETMNEIVAKDVLAAILHRSRQWE
jgi:uncharacterized RDD family membrane protein YckC